MYVLIPGWFSSHRTRPSSPWGWLFALILFVATAFAWPGDAEASGIALNRFGGVFGHANADGGLAMYWNPSRISTRPGVFLTLDSTLVSREATYTRRIYNDERENGEGTPNPYYNEPGVLEANTGEATNSTLAILPFMAGGYVFETSRMNIGLGLTFHPAYGGTARWDKNLSAPSEYPGAVDGVQRWSTLSSRFLILHGTFASAVTFTDLGLSVGAAATLAMGDIATVRARNINRGEALLDESGYIQEGRIFFEGNDSTISLSLGASLERGPVTFSTHYRSGYNLTIRGDLQQAYSTQPIIRARAFLDFPTPHVWNTALTVRLGPVAITAITDYSVWSRMKTNTTFVESDPPDQLLVIPRNLRNTFSVRGMVGYTFLENFEAVASLGFDPSAVPVNSMDPALSDADKWQIGAGVRGMFWDKFGVMLSYTHDIWETVESTRSLHEPTANGTYEDSRRWLNLSLEARL